MGAPSNSPNPCPERKSITLQDLFNLERHKTNHNNKLTTLITNGGGKKPIIPVIDDSNYENGQVLTIISDCNIQSESPPEQDLKRLKLIHLLCLIKSSNNPLPNCILSPLISMLSTNLFRPLPPMSKTCVSSNPEYPEDKDFVCVPSPLWLHLQIIYDILSWLVINIDPLLLQTYIDRSFIANLLTLFQSEEPRERESLKNVCHRIYYKFTSYRSSMRKSMMIMFLEYLFETDQKHCGVGDLLEIWGSIINGFTVPIKEEHKVFLVRVLVPLHKAKGMQFYHRQLAYCVSQFVLKEPGLGGDVIRGMLRYWPLTNCQKEVLMIGELEDLVENVDPELYTKLALPLCTQITKCLNSMNSQVAERALYIWNNEKFVKMVSLAVEEVFPVVVAGMEKNMKCHWSKVVKELTENVKLMLEEIDPVVYSRCIEEIEERESEVSQKELKKKETWERVELEFATLNVNDHQIFHFRNRNGANMRCLTHIK